MANKRTIARILPAVLAGILFIGLLVAFPSIQNLIEVQGQWLFSIVLSALVYVVLDKAFGRVLSESPKHLEAIGIAQAREKQRLENQQKWVDLYQDHSKMIGKAIFESWKNDSGALASWNYQGGRLSVSPRKDSDIDYFLQARSHLQGGYPAVWQQCQEFQTKSIEMSDSAKTWVQSFEGLVREKVKSSCPGVVALPLGAHFPYPAKACHIGTMFSVIFYQVHLHSAGSRYGQFNFGDLTTDIESGGLLMIRETVKYLSFAGESLGHGDMADMQRLEHCVQDLLSDKLIQEYVRQYDQLQTQQRDYSGKLDKESRIILSRVQAGEPLKGSCDLCPTKPS